MGTPKNSAKKNPTSKTIQETTKAKTVMITLNSSASTVTTAPNSKGSQITLDKTTSTQNRTFPPEAFCFISGPIRLNCPPLASPSVCWAEGFARLKVEFAMMSLASSAGEPSSSMTRASFSGPASSKYSS